MNQRDGLPNPHPTVEYDMSTATDLSVTPDRATALTELEAVAKECRTELMAVDAPFKTGFAIARAIRKLNALITDDMMTDVMALQGHPLGFRTDKDRDKTTGGPGPGYPVEVVRPAFIEATVRNFRSVNNEWNIIAGRFYGAKAGFERLVKTYPGLTGFSESASIPERHGDRAFVGYVAQWQLDGQLMNIQKSEKKLADGTPFDDRFVIRVNQGMGDDAILGKCYRKAYAAVYDVLTGSVLGTPEGEVEYGAGGGAASSPVTRSTLFDTSPVTEPTNPAGQDVMLVEYGRKLAECQKKTDVGPIAKQGGADVRLSTESRAEVAKLCTGRRAEL